MLILRVEQSDEPSGSEQRVAKTLRNSGIGGVAVWGAFLPGVNSANPECDFLVITPTFCGILEVKGTESGKSGVLLCNTNSRWQFEGEQASSAVRTGTATNPFGQLRPHVLAVKNVLNELLPGRQMFVNGAVIVVPNGGQVQLKRSAMEPTGLDVVLADPEEEVLNYLRRSGGRPVWDAHAVLSVLRHLEFGPNDVTLQMLRDIGFAEGDDEHAVTPPSGVSAGTSPTLATAIPPSRRPSSAIALVPRPVLRPEPQAPELRRPAPALIAMGVAVVATFGWLALHDSNGDDSPKPADMVSNVQIGETIQPEPGAPTGLFEPPTSTRRPAYKAPPACMPFQEGC